MESLWNLVEDHSKMLKKHLPKNVIKPTKCKTVSIIYVFYSARKQTTISNRSRVNKVGTYNNDKNKIINRLEKYFLVKKLFIRFNTSLSSWAFLSWTNIFNGQSFYAPTRLKLFYFILNILKNWCFLKASINLFKLKSKNYNNNNFTKLLLFFFQ